MKKLELTGMRFGRLLVLSEAEKGKSKHSLWNCICDCGKATIKKGGNLTFGITRSCGCLQAENGRTHGLWGTPIWNTWQDMLRRCYDPRRKEFCNYGGRGIAVCEFLRATPINLLAIIGDKPNGKFSMDRKNNDGGYTCGTCSDCLTNEWDKNIRWATAIQQSRNRRNVHIIQIKNRLLTRPEAAEQIGVSYTTLRSRMSRGIVGEDLLRPTQKAKKYPFEGASLTVSEIVQRTGISRSVIYKRISKGIPILKLNEAALKL